MTNGDNLWKNNIIPLRQQRSRKPKLRKTKRLFHLLFILQCSFSLGWQSPEYLPPSVCVSVVCRPVQKLEPQWCSSSCHTACASNTPKTEQSERRWTDGWKEGAGERDRERNERENGSVSVREKETEQQREGGVSAKSPDFPWDSLTKTDRWERGMGGQKCHFFLLYWTTTRNAWKHQNLFRKAYRHATKNHPCVNDDMEEKMLLFFLTFIDIN